MAFVFGEMGGANSQKFNLKSLWVVERKEGFWNVSLSSPLGKIWDERLNFKRRQFDSSPFKSVYIWDWEVILAIASRNKWLNLPGS